MTNLSRAQDQFFVSFSWDTSNSNKKIATFRLDPHQSDDGVRTWPDIVPPTEILIDELVAGIQDGLMASTGGPQMWELQLPLFVPPQRKLTQIAKVTPNSWTRAPTEIASS